MAAISCTRKLAVVSSIRQELCVADLIFLAPRYGGASTFGGQKGSCGITYQAVRSQRQLSLSALGGEWLNGYLQHSRRSPPLGSYRYLWAILAIEVSSHR